ncbi:thioredoxin family protein [Aequorivita sp. 609]|uniref:thioredoxin family protein n=1 Tax=Aequorivita TaxID=153265 RepID=UPI0011236272|nr:MULTISPECIES: thioredoxin family protein [Aequorivita]MBB6682183.1 thioredoxin family protein [Aequorivita sp. 609]NGX84397.1 thioredoxin family protein [Aequorivita sp. KMM 9714]
MKALLEKSINKAMDYTQYNMLFKQLVEEERTTGEFSQMKVDYTKLNFSRTKRLDKTAKVSEEAMEVFKSVSNKQTWLVITEPWCGDAAQTLPFLNKIAQEADNIDLKIVLRDDNLELMNQFLTNGSQSIPIVIMIDEDMNVLQTFGPRSKAATKLVSDYKEEHGKIDDAFKEIIQVWYNKDKGISIVNDLVNSLTVKA